MLKNQLIFSAVGIAKITILRHRIECLLLFSPDKKRPPIKGQRIPKDSV